MANPTKAGKMAVETFILKAIAHNKAVSKANGKEQAGLHTVWSGFNAAFRQYYGEAADPVAATRLLAEQGKIALRPFKGGMLLYLPTDAPAERPNRAAELLAGLGIDG